jgi:hypothetical protein
VSFGDVAYCARRDRDARSLQPLGDLAQAQAAASEPDDIGDPRRPPSPLQDDDLRADADAIVEVDDVVVHHADAA